VTGAAVLWAHYRGGGQRDYRELTWLDSLLIGLAQATAILPGLSRSGATIAAGLGRGMMRTSAATYSFLLAIPALAGAGAYEAFSMIKDPKPLSASPLNMTIGAIAAFFVGLAAISLLTRILERGRLHYFGWYCIALGLIVIALNWPR